MSQLKKTLFLLCAIFFLAAGAVPTIVQADIVTCTAVADKSGKPVCNWEEFMKTAANLTNALIYLTALGIIAGAALASVSFLLETSFGADPSAGKRSEFRKKIEGMGKFFILTCISWLVINLVSTVFLKTNLSDIFKLGT